MKYTLKVFGVPVLSFERDPESAEEEWEYEEDSGKFGFRV